jgi:hypothetical protein
VLGCLTGSVARAVERTWSAREQFEAYGKQLSVMPVLADIPFDSGGSPEIFEVHRVRKR